MHKPWRALTFIDQHRAPEHDHQAHTAPQQSPKLPRGDPVTSDCIGDTLSAGW